jgi:N-acetylglucosamine kinase-like BadF-type ATPase
MGKFILGVDIGGTKTHALIATDRGELVGFGEAGAGNHETVGYDGLRKALKTSTGKALAEAGLTPADIAGAGFGVAGYDWPSERAATLEAIQTLGLPGPVEAVNDTIIGLIAGATEGWGVGIVAGTGENCWGWDRTHRTGRVTGNGLTMGEFGGAWTVASRALQAVSKAWSRRGPSTRLTEAFLDHTGAPSPDELLEGIIEQRYQINASHAPLVFAVAEQGDEVAVEVIRWAACELAGLVKGVVRQLEFENLAFETVMIGSLFNGGDLLLQPFQTAVLKLAPQAQFVQLTAPPVVGGVLLGMDMAGLDGKPIRSRLIEETIRTLETRTQPERN